MGVHDKCCSKTKEKLKAWKQNLKTPQVHCTWRWTMENHTTYWQMSCSSQQKLFKSKREAQSLKAKSWNSTSSWHFSTENHITYWQMSCSQWGFMTNVAQKQKRSWQPESKILKLHKFTALFYRELYHLLTNELQSMGVLGLGGSQQMLLRSKREDQNLKAKSCVEISC